MKNPYLRSALITLGSFLFVITVVGAWQPPTQTAPDGNKPAPINEGAVDQTKDAGLGLKRLVVGGSSQFNNTVFIGASGLTKQLCLNGDCRSAWLGDSLGNHIATQNIDMRNNFQVTNLKAPQNGTDAATKAYVDGLISIINTKLSGTIRGCHIVKNQFVTDTLSCPAGEMAFSGGPNKLNSSQNSAEHYNGPHTNASGVQDLNGWTSDATDPVGNLRGAQWAVCCPVNP